MRTNKACPMYQPAPPAPPVNVAMTEEQEEEIEKQLNAEDEDLVNVDGTKVKLSGKLLKVSILRLDCVCVNKFENTQINTIDTCNNHCF